jgi:hypothetical protein
MIASPAGRQPAKVAHPHAPRSTEAALTLRAELVQALVEVVDRTFAAGVSPEALRWTADLFGQLDDNTLRALAYRQGLFEEEHQEEEGPRRVLSQDE